MMHAGLLPDERAFLMRPPAGALARVATVGATGLPLVVPVGWSFDDERGELLLGGRDVPSTARWEHVRRTGVAAVVIDGVERSEGWQPWCITMRGAAQADAAAQAIRFVPHSVYSFGLDAVGSGARCTSIDYR